MTRTIEITVPPLKTDKLINLIRDIPEIIGLKVQRGASIQPPGDVINVELKAKSLEKLMRLLENEGVGTQPGTSVTTTEHLSIVSPELGYTVLHDYNLSSWEETEFTLANEGSITPSLLLVMAMAGVIAAIGIGTDALDLVIAAAVIAPGFEPIMRVTHGLISRSPAWKDGIKDTLKGYGTLVACSALTTLLFFNGPDFTSTFEGSTYLRSNSLSGYWTQASALSIVVALAAGAAGAFLITSLRSILTLGVMIALALVPSAALVGMGLATGNGELILISLIRWSIDIGCVLVASTACFGWKYYRVHMRRPSMLKAPVLTASSQGSIA